MKTLLAMWVLVIACCTASKNILLSWLPGLFISARFHHGPLQEASQNTTHDPTARMPFYSQMPQLYVADRSWIKLM